MAFQSGTTIDPSLQRGDMRGFYIGSEAAAQGIKAAGEGLINMMGQKAMQKEKIKGVQDFGAGIDKVVNSMRETGMDIPPELEVLQTYGNTVSSLMKGDDMNKAEKRHFAENFPAITASVLGAYAPRETKPVYGDASKTKAWFDLNVIEYKPEREGGQFKFGGEWITGQQLIDTFGGTRFVPPEVVSFIMGGQRPIAQPSSAKSTSNQSGGPQGGIVNVPEFSIMGK
jgi:hypothetical protein